MAYLGRQPSSSDTASSTDSDLAVRITKEVHDRGVGDSDLTVQLTKELHDRDAGDSDLTFAILDAGTGIDSDF